MTRLRWAASSAAWGVVTAVAELCRLAELHAFHRRQRAHTAAHTGR